MNEITEIFFYLIMSIVIIKLILIESVLLYIDIDDQLEALFNFLLHTVVTLIMFYLIERNAMLIYAVIESSYLFIFFFIKDFYTKLLCKYTDNEKYMSDEQRLGFFMIKNILHIFVLAFCTYIYFFKNISIPY